MRDGQAATGGGGERGTTTSDDAVIKKSPFLFLQPTEVQTAFLSLPLFNYLKKFPLRLMWRDTQAPTVLQTNDKKGKKEEEKKEEEKNGRWEKREKNEVQVSVGRSDRSGSTQKKKKEEKKR